MKRGILIILICLLSLMTVISGMAKEAFSSWNWVVIDINNIQGRKQGDGLFLSFALITTDAEQAARVKEIVASNIYPGADQTVYTDWLRYDEIRSTGTFYQFATQTPYTGPQCGVYKIEVTYKDNTNIDVIQTPCINDWADPYPPPVT